MDTIQNEATRIVELEEWLERVDLYCGIDVNMHTLIEYVHMRITPPPSYREYVSKQLTRAVEKLATASQTPISTAPFEHEPRFHEVE